jgi:hypothetical protein
MFTLSLPIGDVIDLTNYGSPVGNAAIPFSAGLIIVANNQIILSQSPDTYSTLEVFDIIKLKALNIDGDVEIEVPV